MAQEKWEDAQVEWLKVLKLSPQDEVAQWNYELAWFKANPPCALREDDHEPDNTSQEAQDWIQEKAQERMLCPGNEDWYKIELKQGAIFTVRVKASLLPDQDEEAKRKADLRALPARCSPALTSPYPDS